MGPKDSQPFITGELQDMVATVGESFLRKLPRSVIKAPEEQKLRFTASEEGFPLPDWLHFDPEDMAFSGMPTAP